jgi:hypothetical protein
MMRIWYQEDWLFTIEVLLVGKENRSEECHLGLESGDTSTCTFETLAGFRPTLIIKIFPSMEVGRCIGDL